MRPAPERRLFAAGDASQNHASGAQNHLFCCLLSTLITGFGQAAAEVHQTAARPCTRRGRPGKDERITSIDGILTAAVLIGLALHAALGRWWTDPAAGYVLNYYAVRELREIFTSAR